LLNPPQLKLGQLRGGRNPFEFKAKKALTQR